MSEWKRTKRQMANFADALEYLSGASDMPSDIAVTIREAVRVALSKSISDLDLLEETEKAGTKWSDEDITILTNYLSPLNDCENYHQGWEREETLALKLKRGKKSCKSKAKELGFYKKIDYW